MFLFTVTLSNKGISTKLYFCSKIRKHVTSHRPHFYNLLASADTVFKNIFVHRDSFMKLIIDKLRNSKTGLWHKYVCHHSVTCIYSLRFLAALSLLLGLSTQLWHSPSALWPYVHMVVDWWKSYPFSYSSLTYWGMERCSWSACGQRQWHTDTVSLFLSLSQIHTHTHTTLGQQHRWVLGKQAAAGGGKDHKAGWLAKFHHLLWIAWDAHSAATRGMSQIHMQSPTCMHTQMHAHVHSAGSLSITLN